jgi:hypothetical protein
MHKKVQQPLRAPWGLRNGGALQEPWKDIWMLRYVKEGWSRGTAGGRPRPGGRMALALDAGQPQQGVAQVGVQVEQCVGLVLDAISGEENGDRGFAQDRLPCQGAAA